MRKTAKIRITLKSDLCVSSGYGYAGIVDTDICSTANGFPYIPAKRLKGVMRQAAEELLGYKPEALEPILGKTGDTFRNGMVVGNAYVYIGDVDTKKNVYEEFDREISRVKEADAGTILSSQRVLGLFTNIKAQTRIDEETHVAEKNSLRYTRVVNQYMPECLDSEQKELCFEASIEYEQNQEAEIQRILKAVRHIGMDRNRGLGNVKCELITEGCGKIDRGELLPKGDSEKRVEITYEIENVTPLMLSGKNDQLSEKYISGQQVLGALASNYLRMKEITEPDDVFDDLFLSGTTFFSNLYITDGEHRAYAPVPMHIKRLKKSKRYVNAFKINSEKHTNEEYNPANGNQPKKLTGKFGCLEADGKTVHIIEPALDRIYHHSTKDPYDNGKTQEKTGILYYQEALEKGYSFRGTIETKEKYADIICELLKKGLLRFGKSKTSQYGQCRILPDSIKKSEDFPKSMKLARDKELYVVLESDLVVKGTYGYTTDYKEVKDFLWESILGVEPYEDSGEGMDAIMEVKNFSGYNAKITLKRPSVPVVAGGSVFRLKAVKDCQVPQRGRLGSYCAEGFGQYVIWEADQIPARLENPEDRKNCVEKKTDEEESNGSRIRLCKKMAAEINRKEVLEGLKKSYLEKPYFAQKNAAFLGRVTLMLKESSGDLKSFEERVNSIKTDENRQQIQKLISGVKEKLSVERNKELLYCSKSDIDSLWSEYVAFILLHEKYELSKNK